VRSHLSFVRYAVLTGVGLALSALQLVLLPRWLSARDFGLVVLSLSVTHAVLMFGDLGLSRLCIDKSRPPAQRGRLRAEGQSLALMSTAALVTVLAALGALLPERRELLGVLALGGLAAAVVSGDRFRATAREVDGDEVAAAGHNFLWSNAPKVGLLLGVMMFRSPILVVAVSAVMGVALCSPYGAAPKHGLVAARRYRVWLFPFLSIVSSFVVGWSDTYFVSAHLGVARAGSYEAMYRLMGACSYVFLPWGSVVVSRVSHGERRPVLRPLVLAMTLTGLALAAAVALVVAAGPRLFPNLRLPREAIPGLVVFFMLWPVAHCLGSALYVRAKAAAVTVASVASAVVALLGHVIFTLRGGPAEAAAVSASAMAVAVILLARAYAASVRPSGAAAPSETAATG